MVMRRGLGLAVVGLVAGCGDDGGVAPRIDRLAPPAAAVGERLDILGVRFCGPAGSAAAGCAEPAGAWVSFGGSSVTQEALDADWGDERITLILPGGTRAGVTPLVVTVDGRPSNAVDFEVLP